MSEFGQRLKRAIKESGRSREDLAEAIGVSVQAISQVITGKSKAMSAENTAKAARFLKVDWYWLATGSGKMEPAASVAPPQSHWRRVAEEVALQLGRDTMEARRFLYLVDVLAEVIPEKAPDDDASATVARHLRLVA